MFKSRPVLDICSGIFNHDEVGLIIDYYEKPNGSYVETSVFDFNNLALFYEDDEEHYPIAISIVEKLKDAANKFYLRDAEDFILLIWW